MRFLAQRLIEWWREWASIWQQSLVCIALFVCYKQKKTRWKLCKSLFGGGGRSSSTTTTTTTATFLYGKDGSEIATTRIWVNMHCSARLASPHTSPHLPRFSLDRPSSRRPSEYSTTTHVPLPAAARTFVHSLTHSRFIASKIDALLSTLHRPLESFVQRVSLHTCYVHLCYLYTCYLE